MAAATRKTLICGGRAGKESAARCIATAAALCPPAQATRKTSATKDAMPNRQRVTINVW